MLGQLGIDVGSLAAGANVMEVRVADTATVALLDAFYSAAAEPQEWPAAITTLADHLGALGGMLVRNAHDPELSTCVIGRMCPEISARYLREHTDNPWTRAAATVPIGEVAILSRLYDLREGRRLAWYADVIKPARTHDMAFLALPGFTSASSVGGFAFCFSESGARSIDDAAQKISELTPHLERAVWLSQQVDRSRILDRHLDNLLASSSHPVLLVSATCRVVGTNPAADQLLQELDGLAVDSEGHLCASMLPDDKALRAAIIHAATSADGEAGSVTALRIGASRQPTLRLLLTSLPMSRALPTLNSDLQPALLVTVIDSKTSHDNKISSLSKIYDLTPAEARVAVLLATGMGRESAAARLQVSVETIKKHTAACFRKVGVSSQAGLAQLVSGLPV